MKAKKLIMTMLLTLTALTAGAWMGMPRPALHVEGRYLVDENGNKVTLHGFGQTYSPWFNEQGSKWNNYNVAHCLQYNKQKIAGVLAKGWKMNWLRLHMDPYWSNTPGVQTTGENDISAFSMDRFKTYFETVFLPMAQFAEGRGLYVVMRPPGVCPQSITKGDAYYNYLIQVWTHVATRMVEIGNTSIMFELANEPITVVGSMPAFFQGVVDAIRATGCNNILWVPGSGYQSDYRAYAATPIKGENIGYAVHAYPGWYGSDAEVESAENTGDVAGGGYKGLLNGWNERVRCVADFAPVIVTEMDWSPKKYGCSWGKSITGTRGGEGFGANLKFMFDITDNVSWMLFTGPELLAQYDDSAPDGETFLTSPDACARPTYTWFNEYAAEWPASATAEAQTLVSLNLDCESALTGVPGGIVAIPLDAKWGDGHVSCVTAKAEYTFSNPDVAEYHYGLIRLKQSGTTDVTLTVRDITGAAQSVSVTIDVTPFPFSEINPSIYAGGTFDAAANTLITGQWGFGGWQYANGIDLSAYKYIIIELNSVQSAGASFRLFDENNYWGTPAMVEIGSATRKVINLTTLKRNGTSQALNLRHIYIAGFWSTGGKPISIKSIFLTNDPFATSVETVTELQPESAGPQPVYNLGGQRVGNASAKGIYIKGGKKFVSR